MNLILEVSPEPGTTQLWVTFDHDVTHRVELAPLLKLESHRLLRVPAAFARVRVAAGGSHLSWPGGVRLQAASVLEAPDGPQPLLVLAVLPASQRYRPLLPYLQTLVPPLYFREAPIQLDVIARLLQLRPHDLDVALQRSRAPHEQTLNRLYDVATLLNAYFGSEHLPTLLRRPWRYGQQMCPEQGLLHTMLGCLQYGRPDLVEWPCLVLATGGH